MVRIEAIEVALNSIPVTAKKPIVRMASCAVAALYANARTAKPGVGEV